MRSLSVGALVAAALMTSLAACNDKPKSEPQAPPSASAPVAAPTVQSAALPPSGDVSGTVLETMDSGGYTYIRFLTPGGEKWAAVTKAKVAVGDSVTIANASLMTGFASPTLHRTFDQIYFGTLGGPQAAGSGSATAAGSANPHGSAAAAAASVKPVSKATGPNGHTIAELFASKATLKDKPIAVHGTVTKYNPGIMGKNWIHLQDGSSKSANDADLVVTTQGTAALGDVIVVRGVLHTDKNIGSGYDYPVLIEDATIEK